jgi:hypothetical protein
MSTAITTQQIGEGIWLFRNNIYAGKVYQHGINNRWMLEIKPKGFGLVTIGFFNTPREAQTAAEAALLENLNVVEWKKQPKPEHELVKVVSYTIAEKASSIFKLMSIIASLYLYLKGFDINMIGIGLFYFYAIGVFIDRASAKHTLKWWLIRLVCLFIGLWRCDQAGAFGTNYLYIAGLLIIITFSRLLEGLGE